MFAKKKNKQKKKKRKKRRVDYFNQQTRGIHKVMCNIKLSNKKKKRRSLKLLSAQ